MALTSWKELNCTTPFAAFAGQVFSLCGSLPQLLFHRDEIVKLLIKHVETEEAPMAAAPFAALTATLVKDLGEEMVPHFPILFRSLISLLGRTHEVESIEVALGSLFYFIKTLSAHVSAGDIIKLLIEALIMHKLRPQVQDFLAEFGVFVLGKTFEVSSVKAIIVELSGTRQELAVAILAGSCIVKSHISEKRVGKVISLLMKSNRDKYDIMIQMISALIDRTDVQKVWSLVANMIRTEDDHLLIDIFCYSVIFFCIQNRGRLIAEEEALLAAICSKGQEYSDCYHLQEALVYLCSLSNLNVVLGLRSELSPILRRFSGVALLIHICPELIEPTISVSVAAEIISTALFQCNHYSAFELLNRLLSNSSPVVVAQISSSFPAPQLEALVKDGSQAFALRYWALSSLSKITSVKSFPYVVNLLLDEENDLDEYEKIALLNVGSRFISTEYIPSLIQSRLIRENIELVAVLEMLIDLKVSIDDPTILIPHLVTSEARRRSLILQLLSSHFVDSALFKETLALEMIPWTFDSDRDKIIRLQVLGNILRRTMSSPENALEVELVVSHLMGILLAGFLPIKKEVLATLSIVFENHLAPLRKILLELLSRLSTFTPNGKPVKDTPSTLIKDGLVPRTKVLSSALEQVSRILIDDPTCLSIPRIGEEARFSDTCVTPLFQLLAFRPAICDQIVDALLPLIDFIFKVDEATSHRVQNDIEEPEEDEGISQWFVKRIQSSLPDLLTAISGMRSVKSDPNKRDTIHAVLCKFLSFGDASIQRKALDAILALGLYSNIGLYAERLRNLLENKALLREELVALASEQLQLEEDTDKWYKNMLPLLLHLLYGQMISRKGITTSGHNSMANRHKLILNYIVTWGGESLSQFVLFICQRAKLGRERTRSGEKMIGFLTLLGTVIAKIGKKIKQETVDLLMGQLQQILTEPSDDGEVDRKIKRLALKRLCEIYMVIDPDKIDLSQWTVPVWNLLWPRLERLGHELFQESSSIIDLLYFWSESAHFQNILLTVGVAIWPHLVAALGAAKANDNLILQIFNIFDNLLLKKLNKDILATILGDLCQSLNRRIISILPGSGRTKTLILDRAVRMLLELSPLIDASHHSQILMASLLKLLPVKKIIHEESKTQMLHLISRLYDPAMHSQVYPMACSLLSSLRERESRHALASVFKRLAQEQEDLGLFALTLVELHAPSKERIGEYDYEAQGSGFSRLRAEADRLEAPQWAPILQSMFFFAHDEEDTAARTQAFSIINLFVQKCTRMLQHGTVDEVWYPLMLSQLYPAIKVGLKSKAEGVRVDFVSLLNTLIKSFGMVQPFQAMVPLLSGTNDEANFFSNILHLQQHRRSKALRQLTEFARSSPLSKSTIEDVFVPLLKHFVYSESMDRDPIPAPVVHDATMAMAALIARLPPKSVIGRTTKMTQKIRKGRLLYEKTLLKLVPAIYSEMPKDALDETQVTSLINTLFALIASKDGLRPGIAITIAELLPRLQDHLSQLKKLISHLAVMLAHKFPEKRKDARGCVSTIINILGPRVYLLIILRELSPFMTGDFKPHLFAYTLYHILSKLTDWPPLCSTTNDEILAIIFGDMFNPIQASEKSASEWTGKMMEIKTSRSSQSFELLVQKGNIIGAELMRIVCKLRDASLKCSDPEPLDNLCKALENGFAQRNDLGSNDSLAFIYLLINPTSSFYTQVAQSANWTLHSTRFQLVGSRLLYSLIKVDRRSISSVSVKQMIPLLFDQIQNKSLMITTCALKTLNHLLREELTEEEEHQLETLLDRLFTLIISTDVNRHADLIRSSFKLIATLVRERDRVQLTETQLKALLSYVKLNLEKETAQGAIAHDLIKTVLRRRVLLPEVYELINVIKKSMLRSFYPGVRHECRSAYLIFLLDYPLGRAKLEEHFAFLVTNLTYEVDGGRESITLFIAMLLEKLSFAVLEDFGETLLVALAARLVNEASNVVKTAVRRALHIIISRFDARLVDRLMLIQTKWLEHASSTVQLTAWSLVPIVLKSAKHPITPLIRMILSRIDVAKKEHVEALQTLFESPDSLILEKVLSIIDSVDITLDQRNQFIAKYFETVGPQLNDFPGHIPNPDVIVNWCQLLLVDLQLATVDSEARLIVENLLFILDLLHRSPLAAAAEETAKIKSCTDFLVKIETTYRQLPARSSPLFASSMLKLFAALIIKVVPLTEALATPMMMGALRVRDAPISSTNDIVLAQQVLDLLAHQLSDQFVQLQATVMRSMTAIKRKRREDEARLAVIDPRAFSRRKLQRANRAKLETRRRKFTGSRK